MTRLAANLTMLYNEVDFIARFEAAAKSGTGVNETLKGLAKQVLRQLAKNKVQ